MSVAALAAACSGGDGNGTGAGRTTLPNLTAGAGSSVLTGAAGTSTQQGAAGTRSTLGGTAGTFAQTGAGFGAVSGVAGIGSLGPAGVGAFGEAGTAPIGPSGSGGMTTPPGGAAGTGSPAPTSGTGPVMTSKDPKIPPVNGDCPQFKEGTTTADFMGLKGVIFEVGAKQNGSGSLIFYWHGTGSFSGEYASSTFPAPALSDLKAKGGILVSPQSGTGSGGDCSGTGTFAMDDFKVADQIAACAVRDWNIDPHRIWASGCSAGGLQSGCMAQMRSSYLAGAVPNSGGEVFPIGLEDPGHVGSIMTIHGAPGQDVVIVDFSNTSKTMDDAIKMAGGFAVDCNHGGGHCGLPLLPAEVAMAGWQFIQDHPFGVSPEPYKDGLPSSFPMYCKIW